jgi:hypothetical protein
MYAGIAIFLMITVIMIFSIAYTVAQNETGIDSVTEEEALAIKHVLNEDLDNLRSDNAFIAGSDLTLYYLQDGNETRQAQFENEWMKTETLENLDIDMVVIKNSTGDVTFRSSVETVDHERFIEDLSHHNLSREASGFIHLDGKTCMFSSRKVNFEEITLFKVLTENDLRSHNPLPYIKIDLYNLVEGPVSEELLKISRNGQELFNRNGCFYLILEDEVGEEIATIKLSK